MENKTETQIEIGKLSFEKEFPTVKGWDLIGFHRTLGKELWEFAFEMIMNFFWVFVIGYLVPLINPYPEIDGYAGVANGLFLTVYVAFDIGTNFPYPRFISELQIKNPPKMMEYIRFVIWYQMMTGLVQITILSFFTFYVILHNQYAHLTWLLLLILQKQWPGMLGIFNGILEGCQQWGMLNKMNWFRELVLNWPMRIGFALIGKWWGTIHPEYGVILSMAIFAIISNYVIDVLFLFVSGYFFSQILKPFGYRFRDAWKWDIGKDVWMTAAKYGVQASIIPIISSAISTVMLLWYLTEIPGIITWRALVSMGTNLTGLMWSMPFPMSPMIAEAYMNGKKELAEFYCSYFLKWKYFFLILLATIIFSIQGFYSLLLGNYAGLQYYSLAVTFIIPAIINNLIWPLFNLPGDILWGAEKITLQNIFSVINMVLNMAFAYLWLIVVRVQDYGLIGIIFLLCFENLIPNLIVCCLRWYYVKKHILQYRVYWTSTFVLPILSGIPIYLIANWYIVNIFPTLHASLGFEIAIFISLILAVFVLLFGIFFPLTGILGVWDDYMVFVFDQAVELAGPSKGVFRMASKLMKFGIRIGRKLGTHGRWSIPWEKAHEQVHELMVLREANRAKAKNEVISNQN